MRPDSTRKPSRGTSKTSRITPRSSPKVQHVDSSRPGGLTEPTSVQDRIRQWQVQGAEALDPDVVSVRSIPVSDCPSIATRPKSEYGDNGGVRIGGRGREDDKSDEYKDRSKSTPRRRIISDSHWKGQREAKDKDVRPGREQRHESRRYDPTYTSNQERPRQRRRSKQHESPAPGQEVRQATLFDDGIRITLETEDPPRKDIPFPYDLDSGADEDLARHLTTESICSGDFERHSEASNRPGEDEPGNNKPSRYAQSLARAEQDTDRPKPRRSGLLGKTRDMFMKSEAVPQVSNRVPSIEAWLYEQPDPFIEEGSLEDLPPVEVPKPLRKRTHRNRSSEVQSVLIDPNQIWNAISPKTAPEPHEKSRNDGSIYSPDGGDCSSTPKLRTPRDTSQDDSDGSPSSLRRRGARLRRQRDVAGRETTASANSPEPPRTPIEGLLAEEPTTKATSPPRRPCPPTGAHQLSTIASVETFQESTLAPHTQNPIVQDRTELTRKLTTHDDLMSVLSMPRRSKNRRSARTARGSRARQTTGSAQDVLTGLAVDEQKYGRELQTLVDGVIPVLLQCALSKTDSAAVAALFMSSTANPDGMGMTKPIIEMGIALERLKSYHKRIPLENVEALLSWARTSEKAYRDYLQAWRLGFEDVVVNLAPIDSSTLLDQGMSMDEAGDMVDGEGKKADVAYLLKRPLVRVKALSRAFSQIRDECDMPLAAQMADAYSNLAALARRRNQEEQARMEDEAAANVDATRTRDIRTLAPTTQVSVSRTRRVKARDFFNLTVYHSSGQRLDCGIELVFRDNAHGEPVGGDVFVCEVDNTDKWLLFAPIESNCISARRGEDGFDLVVMVRGRAGMGKEWHELLALKTDDKDAVKEWMDMLGSNPLPPRLNRTPDAVPPPAPLAIAATAEFPSTDSGDTHQIVGRANRTEQPDVPIGEPSVLGASSQLKRHSGHTLPFAHRLAPGLSLGGGLTPKPIPQHQIPSTTIPRRPVPSVVSSDRSTISDRSFRDSSTVFTASSSNTTSTKLGTSLSSQSRHSQLLRSLPLPHFPQPPKETRSQSQGIENRELSQSPRRENVSDGWKASQTPHAIQSLKPTVATAPPQTPLMSQLHATSKTPPSKPNPEAPVQRPVYHRAVSSTPSKDLPTVNKLRTQPALPAQPSPSSTHTVGHSPETQPPSRKEDHGIHRSDRGPNVSARRKIYTEDIPAPPAHMQRQDRSSRPSSGTPSSPPATPPHRTGVLQPVSNNKPSPVLKPTPSPSDKIVRRRTSSPLKHEYAPSTSSGSSSDYDSESESDSSSDTSEDPTSEHGDIPTPLVAITGGDRRASKPPVPPSMPPSSYQISSKSTGTRTLAPSDSASQGPYRKAPSSSTFPANKKSRTIALICSWSDRGMWEQIHPDECSIVISPGLIEAFEMSAAHSRPRNQSLGDTGSTMSSPSQQPLISFELTPIVPLRRGTALDISLRSPPTANSKIRTSNNVMFRSRNPEECEALYGMINWARCNNPTYIQLQAARPHRQPSVIFNVGQAQNGRAKSSSWFSFGSQKKSSYRASSAPTPASVDMSVESSGTMNSAFSALKRFGVSNAFNLNRSSVLRKDGSSGTGDSLYSSSSGTRTGSGSSTPAPSQAGFIPGKDGPNVPSTSAAAAEGGGMVNNMKIRLYVRKGQGWDNLGAARLTVLPASPPQSGQTTPRHSRVHIPPAASPPATPAHSRSPSTLTPIGAPGTAHGPRLPSSTHTPHRIHGNGREKRIFITLNKSRDAVLLDTVLGESCFERVMQTGIAVKVWSEADAIAHTGGVTLGKERVYMLQFGGAREAGWVFGLVGTYRYGGGGVGGIE